MKRKFLKGLSLILVLMMIFGAASLVLADDISNKLDTSVDAVAEIMPLNANGANGSTQLYLIEQNGDGKQGCNLTGQTTLVVSVASSDTAVATVSPASVTFTSCGDTHMLTITPHNQGSATISLSQTSNTTGGTFNLAPATFTVNVAGAPSTNTAPKVSITGVTGGERYEIGAVPAATCEVIDAEDGNSSFGAALSAITGDKVAFGLGDQTASCSYTDKGNLKATASATYSIIDSHAPAANPSVTSGILGNNGWYTSDVTVNWDWLDSGAGIDAANCLTSSTFTDEGQIELTATCKDVAGNEGRAIYVLKVDKTQPIVELTATGKNGQNGWFVDDVTITTSGSDEVSGIASCTDDQQQTEETEGQTFTGSCTDNAGLSSAATPLIVKLDKTGPSANLSAVGTLGNEGWYTSDVTIKTIGDDDISNPTICTANQSLKTDSSGMTFNGSCTNNAGLRTDASPLSIKRDATAPAVILTPNRQADHNGWYNHSLSFDITGSDGDEGSGLDKCGSPVVYDGPDSAAASVSGTCTDLAGNVGTGNSAPFQYDATKPELNISGASGGSSDVCSALPSRPSFAPTDNLSGINVSSDSWEAPSTTSGAGTYTYTATATDQAGNSASDTRVYKVTYGSAFGGFLQPINQDGSSRFKLGSTIPVKFQIKCGASPISTVVAKLNVKQEDGTPNPGTDETISTAASTTGNLFRFDGSAQQYIFNLSTKLGYTSPDGKVVMFSTGSWTLSVLLDDGSYRSINIQLPK